MSMQIVFEQILIIFGYVIVGYVAGKKNLITKEQQRYLSKLVSSLILPFTVLSASSMEASGQDIVNVAIAVALLFSCMALTSAGCMLYAKIKQVPEKKRAAYTGLCTYPNCTFIIGFSLLNCLEFFVFRKMKSSSTINHPLCGCESNVIQKKLPFRVQ